LATNDRNADRTSAVGIPGAEAQLTRAAIDCAADLIRPGAGRSLFVLAEVEIGIGRPDLLFLTASSVAVGARRKQDLRLQNWVEARVLGSWLNQGTATGVSPSHVSAVSRRLRMRGWTAKKAETALPLVADSLVVEAKVSGWKSGLAQLARTRRLTHRSALLLPTTGNRLVDRRRLKRGNVGLILFDQDGGVSWRRKAPKRSISPAAKLWLGELAIRASEDGRSQSPSAVRKESRLKRKVSRR
jgi:hypothetical protein